MRKGQRLREVLLPAPGLVRSRHGCQAGSVGAVETDRSFGTVEYEIALMPAEECSLDGWFRCVDDGSVFSWR